MKEQENVQVVQQAFAAFGRGDIPTVLGLMASDVEWYSVGPVDILPWAGVYHGPEQVGKFFVRLAESMEFQQFEPQEFIAQGDRVVALGHTRAVFKATGRVSDQDWIMVFTVRDGKIVYYRYLEDTAAAVVAFQGK